jgi:hypothetical protein
MFQRTMGDAIYALSVMAIMFLVILTIGFIIRWIVRRSR